MVFKTLEGTAKYQHILLSQLVQTAQCLGVKDKVHIWRQHNSYTVFCTSVLASTALRTRHYHEDTTNSWTHESPPYMK